METSRESSNFLPMLQMPAHSHPPASRQTSDPVNDSSVGTRHALSTSIQPLTPPPERNDPVARHPVYHSSESFQDVEGTQSPRYTNENDPFQLSSRLKTDVELEMIRVNTSRKRDGLGPITTNKEATKAKRLQQFYEGQNENIERWLKPVDEHVRLARKLEGDNNLKFKTAVYGSFAANIVLAILQIFAAAYSGSLSLFTTMADAVFDPMSNLTLILCARAIKKVDPRRFPSGKARIETAGNIVFCFLMTSVSFLIIVLSCMELAEGNYAEPRCEMNTLIKEKRPTKAFHMEAIIAVGIAFATKVCLFCYCWALRNNYSQIRILWEDHRNDMIINGIGILTSLGGSWIAWWIDPAGAIVLSVIISTLWLHTAYREFQLLIGVTADTQMQQWITYISMTHSPTITAIDTVRAYHSGPRIIVEVDVVMDPEESLRESHDVAEALQTKLERLPDVERAYVHIDYETSHKPEHFLKKEL